MGGMYALLAALVICGVGQHPVSGSQILPSPYVLNSPVYCGQTTQIGDQPVLVVPYKEIGDVGNPTMECMLTIESPYQESHYKFSIMVKAATFVDCGMKLYIYNGRGVGSNIHTLGCGTSSASTGTYYSSDAMITLRLTRTAYDYQFGNNFQLEIQLYISPTTAATTTISTATTNYTIAQKITNKTSNQDGANIIVIVLAVVAPICGLLPIGGIIYVVILYLRHHRTQKSVHEIPDGAVVQ